MSDLGGHHQLVQLVLCINAPNQQVLGGELTDSAVTFPERRRRARS